MTNTITLRFLPHLATANIAGTKTRTTRTKQHGKAGDIFFCSGIAFVITKIERERLIDTAYAWKEEGYQRKEDFLQDLKTIYPDLQTEIFTLMLSEAAANCLKECGASIRGCCTAPVLNEGQQKRYEERIRRRYSTILYAHHYCKYGHLDLETIGGIPPAIWHSEEVTIS